MQKISRTFQGGFPGAGQIANNLHQVCKVICNMQEIFQKCPGWFPGPGKFAGNVHKVWYSIFNLQAISIECPGHFKPGPIAGNGHQVILLVTCKCRKYPGHFQDHQGTLQPVCESIVNMQAIFSKYPGHFPNDFHGPETMQAICRTSAGHFPHNFHSTGSLQETSRVVASW